MTFIPPYVSHVIHFKASSKNKHYVPIVCSCMSIKFAEKVNLNDSLTNAMLIIM